jgi:hypothetical protein
VFCENCDIAELKGNLDESQHRFLELQIGQ